MVLSEKYHKNAIKILIREWYFCGTLPKVPLNFVVQIKVPQKYHSRNYSALASIYGWTKGSACGYAHITLDEELIIIRL